MFLSPQLRQQYDQVFRVLVAQEEAARQARSGGRMNMLRASAARRGNTRVPTSDEDAVGGRALAVSAPLRASRC